MNILKRIHQNLHDGAVWKIWDAQLTYSHLVIKLTDFHDNHFTYKIKLSDLNEQSVDKMIKTLVEYDVKWYLLGALSRKKPYYRYRLEECCDIFENGNLVMTVKTLNIKQILENF
jgi:hypothetical protein